MTNRSLSLEYLARLQGNKPSPTRQREEVMHKQALTKKGMILPWLHAKLGSDVLSINEALLSAFRKYGDYVPPCDSVLDYAIMHRQKEVFDRAIHERFQNSHTYHTTDMVDFGTLESPILNAMITPVPGCNEFLIIFNRGLWQSLMAFSCLVAGSLDFSQPLFLFRHEKAIEYSEAFATILQRVLLQKDIPLSHPTDLTGTVQQRYWNVFHEGMQGFVFAHEYAHLLHRHLAASSMRVAGGIAEEQLNYYEPSWNQEYEADRTGLDLVVFASIIEMEERKDLPMLSSIEKDLERGETIFESLGGTLLCIHFLCWIERMTDLVYTPTGSHPPTWFRIQKIMGTIPHQCPDPQTRDFFLKRIGVLTECVSFFFNSIARPIHFEQKDPLMFYERRLQDIVFYSLFHRTYFDVLMDLYRDRNILLGVSQKQNVLDAMNDKCSYYLQRWTHALKFGTFDFTVSETVQMIDRCIGILERNADIFGFNKPKST